MSEGSFAQQLELVGIAVQRQKPIADQVHRRFVTGAEQQDDIGGQLLVRELAAVLLGLHQLRREILAGLAPAQLEQPMEILGRRQIGRILLLDLGAAERRQVEQAPPGARTGEEQLPVLRRYAEHVADHGHRQPEGEIRDEVHMGRGLRSRSMIPSTIS